MSEKKRPIIEFAKKAFGKDSPLKKTLLSKGLPLLANVLTGGAAGPFIGLVKDIVGVQSDDPNELDKAINDDPEVVARLKELEMNQKVKLEQLALETAQLEFEETKAYIGDVQNARNREIELTKATGKRDWLLMALAITVVVGFFALIATMMIVDYDEKVSGPLNQLFGALVAGFTMVLAYFFGSSKGSADKSAAMERQATGTGTGTGTGTKGGLFNNAKG